MVATPGQLVTLQVGNISLLITLHHLHEKPATRQPLWLEFTLLLCTPGSKHHKVTCVEAANLHILCIYVNQWLVP